MSETKHTPGPWRVGAYGTTVMTDRPNSQANDTICSLHMPIHSGVGELLLPQDARTEQVEANARLIAAAPDLLKASKRALAVLRATGESIRPGNALGALVAAIAKAEGGEQ